MISEGGRLSTTMRDVPSVALAIDEMPLSFPRWRFRGARLRNARNDAH
jgi:hypothetical protein